MAFTAPPIAHPDKKDSRGTHRQYRRWKDRQWAKGNRDCFWCSKPCIRVPHMPLTMSVDHKVPLHRGGLDHSNNWVVAHQVCNHNRGHDMPELEELDTSFGGLVETLR